MKRKKCLKKIVCEVFAVVLFVSLMFNPSCCYAEDPELPNVEIEGVIYSKTEENGEPVAFVSWYDKKNLPDEVDVCILENVEIEGDFCTVKSIGESAFERCEKIRSVLVPSSVKSIRSDAFWRSRIQSVTLEGVESIGTGAFYNCENLVSVDVQSDIKLIRGGAFSDCINLSFFGSMDIKKDVKLIEDVDSSDCISRKEIEIPHGLDCIEKYVFSNCKSIERLVIPGNIKSIKKRAFQGLSSLKELKIEEGVENIGNEAFKDCVKIENLELPKSVHTIGCSAFCSCRWLTEVNILGEVKSIIDGYIFEECEELVSVHMNSESKGKIYKMFTNWPMSLDFPEVYIEDRDKTLALFGEKIDINNEVELGGVMYGICSTDEKLAFVTGYSNFMSEAKIEERINVEGNEYNVVGISDGAFYACESLYNIEIPSSVKFIGDSAFYGCTKLNYVEFKDGIKRIGEGAFFACPITILYLNRGVESVGECAFMDCGFEEITIPGNVEIIEDRVFVGNGNLERVNIEEGVSHVGCDAFSDYPLTSPQQLIFPKSLKELGALCLEADALLTLPRRRNFVENIDKLFPNHDSSKITWLPVDDEDPGTVHVYC